MLSLTKIRIISHCKCFPGCIFIWSVWTIPDSIKSVWIDSRFVNFKKIIIVIFFRVWFLTIPSKDFFTVWWPKIVPKDRVYDRTRNLLKHKFQIVSHDSKILKSFQAFHSPWTGLDITCLNYIVESLKYLDKVCYLKKWSDSQRHQRPDIVQFPNWFFDEVFLFDEWIFLLSYLVRNVWSVLDRDFAGLNFEIKFFSDVGDDLMLAFVTNFCYQHQCNLFENVNFSFLSTIQKLLGAFENWSAFHPICLLKIFINDQSSLDRMFLYITNRRSYS